MEDILIGTTDRSILVFVADPASTDGSGKTGLAHSAVTVSYTRVETDNDVVVTDVTSSLNALTNLTDPHNDWGWKEVSSTLAPGLYRLDVADAVFAAGAWTAVIYVMITASEAAPAPVAFRLMVANSDVVLAAIAALNNVSAAQVNAEVDTAISDAALATAAALSTAQTTISAVKLKTDSLTFTQAGHVDANVQRINDVALTGDGSATPWGPV